jgi:hypothetical protein
MVFVKSSILQPPTPIIRSYFNGLEEELGDIIHAKISIPQSSQLILLFEHDRISFYSLDQDSVTIMLKTLILTCQEYGVKKWVRRGCLSMDSYSVRE